MGYHTGRGYTNSDSADGMEGGCDRMAALVERLGRKGKERIRFGARLREDHPSQWETPAANCCQTAAQRRDVPGVQILADSARSGCQWLVL